MAQNVRENRNLYIGGSDIPIIMGISPFKKRFDLLLEKAGLKENDFEGNDYTEFGNIIEPMIRTHINKIYNRRFREDKFINGNKRCHVDGADETTILEVKSTSQIKNELEDYMIYLVQLLFYMNESKREDGVLAVYERPKNFDLEQVIFEDMRLTIFENIRLEDYEDLVEKIYQAIDQFEIDLEKVKENPFITEEELQPKEIIELSSKVLQLENDLKDYELKKKQYEEMKNQLFETMTKYNCKTWRTNNNVLFTKVDGSEDTTEIVKEFNQAKFEEDFPDLYEKYIEEKTKTKKGRKGYLKITMPKVK